MARQDDTYLDDFGEDADNLFATETYRSYDGVYYYKFKDPKMQMISIAVSIIIGIIILIIKAL